MDLKYLAKLLVDFEEKADDEQYVKIHLDVLRPLMAQLIKEAAEL